VALVVAAIDVHVPLEGQHGPVVRVQAATVVDPDADDPFAWIYMLPDHALVVVGVVVAVDQYEGLRTRFGWFEPAGAAVLLTAERLGWFRKPFFQVHE
jgi:hypothetical protein